MNIALITQPITGEFENLKKIAEERGHTLDIITFAGVELNNFINEIEKKNISSYDLVHYETSLKYDGGYALNNYLKEKDTLFINKDFYNNPSLFESKIHQIISCSGAGIRCPKTYIFRGKATYDEVSTKLGNTFVVKSAHGLKGTSVFLIKSEEDFNEAKEKNYGAQLYQEPIPNTGDFRVHVIGHTVPVIYKRIPRPGNFVANVSQGGSMEKVEDKVLYKALSDIALKAASVAGLQHAGIDIIQSEKDSLLYFIEANDNPGLKNVKEVTGISIPEKLIDYYEELYLNR